MFYPQLNDRCSVQYPLKKLLSARAIANEMIDGERLCLPDLGTAAYEWQLSYRGLTRDEAVCLKVFFESVEGTLKPFTFIDPVGNILRFSENLATPPWQLSPGINVESDAPDPFGAHRATRLVNTTSGTARLSQTATVPGSYTYCLSLWGRGSGPSAFSAGWTSGDGSVERIVRCTDQWSRSQAFGSCGSSSEATTFWVELPPGGAVELFGLQVEGQLQASAYRRTYSECAVFDTAHFVDDEFTIVASARGEYAVDTRVEARRRESE